VATTPIDRAKSYGRATVAAGRFENQSSPVDVEDVAELGDDA
jgi:hypothetical protein